MIISCEEIRSQILNDVKKEVSKLSETPTLAIVTCSYDEPSQIYVKNKVKTACEVGIEATHYNLEPTMFSDTTELVNYVQSLNEEHHAIIVQLPLHEKFDSEEVIKAIEPDHDVDGLTNENIARLVSNDPKAVIPATAGACYEIIKHTTGKSDLSGLNITIINRSHLIGKPLFQLLLNSNATVTVCHSKTANLDDHIKNSDVVVIGIGRPHYFADYQFISGTLVLDCGISRVDGKIVRDVQITDSEYIDYAGKVGIITTAYLMKSVVQCYKQQLK